MSASRPPQLPGMREEFEIGSIADSATETTNRRDETYQRAKTFNGLSAREWTLLSRNVWNDVSSPREARHLKHGAVYPVKLADRIIRIYSKESDLVLDPFLGIGSTCIAAIRAGRRSIGVELNHEFCNAAKDWVNSQLSGEKLNPQIIHGDALQVVKTLSGVQLTLTSPPYANFIARSIADRKKTHKKSALVLKNNSCVRVYSDHENDFGNLPYEEFLDSCERLLEDTLHATLPGGYAVWIVKDHRLPPERPYIAMHSDLASRAQRVGWKWHDLITWDQNEQRSLVLLGYPSKFYTNVNSSFLVVLRKPN